MILLRLLLANVFLVGSGSGHWKRLKRFRRSQYKYGYSSFNQGGHDEWGSGGSTTRSSSQTPWNWEHENSIYDDFLDREQTTIPVRGAPGGGDPPTSPIWPSGMGPENDDEDYYGHAGHSNYGGRAFTTDASGYGATLASESGSGNIVYESILPSSQPPSVRPLYTPSTTTEITPAPVPPAYTPTMQTTPDYPGIDPTSEEEEAPTIYIDEYNTGTSELPDATIPPTDTSTTSTTTTAQITTTTTTSSASTSIRTTEKAVVWPSPSSTNVPVEGLPHGTPDTQQNSSFISFDPFRQPGILAAVIAGAVLGLVAAVILVGFVVYRMRKKDEGSYVLDEPKAPPLMSGATSNGPSKNSYPYAYHKASPREFYA